MSTIVITEKPSVAQEYIKILKMQSRGRNDGYAEGFSSVLNTNVIVTWAVGHLISLCPPDIQNPAWTGKWDINNLPMIPDKFKYEPQKATLKQFKIVKSLYLRNDIERIYYAGDSGREGIYIQALIRNQIFKSKPANIDERVVWISSFTEPAILEGIRTAKPYEEYQNLIDSGYARAISDWLIGMNFTEGFTLTSGTLINTGRVLTPTLAMVVKRQEDIDNFVKTDFFGVKANDNILWRASEGSRFYDSPLLYNETGFLRREDAENFINDLSQSKLLAIEKVEVKKKTEYAPLLFNLSDFQSVVGKALHISADKALDLAQSLYEKKFTTYPRTDSRYLSTAVATDLASKGYNIPKKYVNDDKIEDHYAIIPTFYGNPDELSDIERSAYNIILKRFLDITKPPFVYNNISVVYKHQNGEHFYESFKNVVELGYKEGSNVDTTQRPVPQEHTSINVTDFSLTESETKPPVPYSEYDMPKEMGRAGRLIEDENLRNQIKETGIGTQATRASIVKRLIDKKFITVDKKQKIAPTELGKKIIPIVAKFDETLVSPVMTADMETKLDEIAKGNLSKETYLAEIEQYVSDTTKKIIAENHTSLSSYSGKSMSTKVHKCPCCGKDLKFGRYGWYCECKFSFGLEICGHKMKESDLEDLINNGETKSYTFKWKSGKSSKAKIALNKEEHKTEFKFDNSFSNSKATGSKNLNSCWSKFNKNH